MVERQHKNTEIDKINIIPGVETMIWQRVKMASRKSLWTWTEERERSQLKKMLAFSLFIYLRVLTVFLRQQATSFDVKLLFADLLFEPKFQICPVTEWRQTTKMTLFVMHLQHARPIFNHVNLVNLLVSKCVALWQYLLLDAVNVAAVFFFFKKQQ